VLDGHHPRVSLICPEPAQLPAKETRDGSQHVCRALGVTVPASSAICDSLPTGGENQPKRCTPWIRSSATR
jgi:hypothetical protein